jgi:hypothetical protein
MSVIPSHETLYEMLSIRVNTNPSVLSSGGFATGLSGTSSQETIVTKRIMVNPITVSFDKKLRVFIVFLQDLIKNL